MAVPMVASGIHAEEVHFFVDERPTKEVDRMIEDPGPVWSISGKVKKQIGASRNAPFLGGRFCFLICRKLKTGDWAFSEVIRNTFLQKIAFLSFWRQQKTKTAAHKKQPK
jgi:hypothetical protein